MFLNISKCYLNTLFVSLFHNPRPDRQLTESSLTATIFPQATGEDYDAPITHPFKGTKWNCCASPSGDVVSGPISR